jgi:hypothetical protein
LAIQVGRPRQTDLRYNNVFHGNAGKDFTVDSGTDITLVDNVIGTHSWAGTTTNSGTTTADPQLDPTTFRPIEAPASNVINSGSTDAIGGLPATDLSGRARQVGSGAGSRRVRIDDQRPADSLGHDHRRQRRRLTAFGDRQRTMPTTRRRR